MDLQIADFRSDFFLLNVNVALRFFEKKNNNNLFAWYFFNVILIAMDNLLVYWYLVFPCQKWPQIFQLKLNWYS